jgi:adenine-specific DNA-methyltransferase
MSENTLTKEQIEKLNKDKYGQFFSKNPVIRNVIQSLISNKGTIMEPSVGEGDLIFGLEDKNPTLIDFKPKVNNINGVPVIEMDFFSYSIENKFNTIIGNPPFVKYKFLDDSVKQNIKHYEFNKKLNPNGYNKKSNLYYFFIHKCIEQLEENGELIFITPKEFMYNVGAITLRNFMFQNGTITHFVDCGEKKLFSDASVPSLCIFRFQKNMFIRETKFWETIESYVNKEEHIIKPMKISNDQFCFCDDDDTTILSDFFDVKVGVVSGLDRFYETDRVEDAVYIHKFRTNSGYKNYYFFDHIDDINLVPEDIRTLFLNKKETLKNRKIKKYTDNDWWKYGAVRNLDNMLSDKNRIYVAPKTRLENPFFMGTSNELYSGSLLGIFPKKDNIDLEKSISFFNSNIFKERLKQFFIMIEDKFNFTPSVLGKIPLNLNEIV